MTGATTASAAIIVPVVFILNVETNQKGMTELLRNEMKARKKQKVFVGYRARKSSPFEAPMVVRVKHFVRYCVIGTISLKLNTDYKSTGEMNTCICYLSLSGSIPLSTNEFVVLVGISLQPHPKFFVIMLQRDLLDQQ